MVKFISFAILCNFQIIMIWKTHTSVLQIEQLIKIFIMIIISSKKLNKERKIQFFLFGLSLYLCIDRSSPSLLYFFFSFCLFISFCFFFLRLFFLFSFFSSHHFFSCLSILLFSITAE